MYMGVEMARYFRQLDAYLQAQYQRMEEMSRLMQQLQQDMKELKNKNDPPQVVRNEYKFDLLKVERLEGTLSIGLHPKGTDSSSIDEFAVNQTMSVPQSNDHQANSTNQSNQTNPTNETTQTDQPKQLFQNVQKQINLYLDYEAYKVLECLEQQYNWPLDNNYRQFIIDDIKKQIEQRIRYYLNQFNTEQLQPEQCDAIEQATIQNVIKDIDNTCEKFIQNLPKERSE